MKKTMLIVTAVAALNFTSCEKKISDPKCDSFSTSHIQNPENFKFIKNFRISDESKKYYVDVVIKSNNKKAFDFQCENIMNSKMILLKIKPESSQNPQNVTSTVSSDQELPKIDINNVVAIDIKSYEKGSFMGFTISYDNARINSRTNEFIAGSGGYYYHLPDYCNSYQVTNYATPFMAYDYYYSGSDYVLYSYQYIYGSWIFSGPGYTQRMCLISTPGSWACDISIYS